MKKTSLTFILIGTALLLSCSKWSVHYVILETNMQNVGYLQDTLKKFRPNGISLPNYYEDIAPPKPWKTMFWYQPTKDSPRKPGILNSPADTAGLNVVEINYPNYKPSFSKLEPTVNGYGEHYCIKVRQFKSYRQAKKYIEILKEESVIDSSQIAFPVPKKKIDLLKTKEYDYFKFEY